MRVRNHANPLNYYERMKPFDFNSAFGKTPDLVDLEIGFGRGIFLRNYAAQFTDRFIIGLDVRSQIVALLQQHIDKEPLGNVALIHGNAALFLEDSLPQSSLDRVFVFHPDPWLKKRHHKRRVIQPAFLDVLVPKLKPNGRLYFTTDVESLFDEMVMVCDHHQQLARVEDSVFWDHYYQSHWDAFSIEDDRLLFKSIYERHSSFA